MVDKPVTIRRERVGQKIGHLSAAGAREMILISHQAISAEVAHEHAPDRTLTLLQSFTGAEEAWEITMCFAWS
jgi:hypothetical protein